MTVIYILEILERYACEDKKMTQKQLKYYLQKDYGIDITEKTISKYINMLREYKYVAGERGIYKVNKFTDMELRLLMDGVLYGKHIPQIQALELLEKVKSLSPEKLRKTKHIHYIKELQHTENEKLYDILDGLYDAIEQNKKVKLTKCTYNANGELEDGEERIVSPYSIVSSKSMYYLICYSGRNGQLENRRIDRISKVTVLEDAREKLENLDCNKNQPFDLATYMQEHIYMFSGESERIVLKIAKETMGDVIDWYGKNYYVLEQDQNTITIRLKANTNAVYYWAMQYGQNVEVLEPIGLRNKICRGLKDMLEKYEEGKG